MAHKRKRSVSELCPSPSSVSSLDSPPRPGNALINPFAIMAAAPIHLHSRTMKRFRDSRPSAETIHRKFSLNNATLDVCIQVLNKFQNVHSACYTQHRTNTKTQKSTSNIHSPHLRLLSPNQTNNLSIDFGTSLQLLRHRTPTSTKLNSLLRTAMTAVLV